MKKKMTIFKMIKCLLLAAVLCSCGSDSGDGAVLDKECGGLAARGCEAGTFCRFPEGTCGAGNVSGECAVITEICTLEYSPFCGCDGVTYGNACAAQAASVSIAAAGECPEGD